MMASSTALASVNLPLHHWAYEAIERLVALGVIDRAMIIPKPYSRKQAAIYVARAIERIRTDEAPAEGQQAIAEPLLERLLQFLQPELGEQLGVTSNEQRDRMRGAVRSEAGEAIRFGGRLQVEGDAFSVGHGTVRLRENDMGRYYANGEQVRTDFRGWIELTDALALSIDPQYISNAHALGIGATENNHNAYLQEFNAKLTLFNIALQVGRSSLWWGPGYNGTLLMSDHHFPLDMLQLGSEEPFRLPWVFRPLGEWKIQSFLTKLERDRDFPRAQVFGLRISYLPVDWIEIGLTRLTQFDGRGHDGKDQYFPAILVNSYLNNTNKGGPFETNEQAMADFRVRVPSIPYLVPFPAGMQVYGEYGLEDPPVGIGIVFGVYIPQVLKSSTTDFRIEYADTDIRRRFQGNSAQWYNNGVRTSGMRYRGFPLGHWMGTDAIDLFTRTTSFLTDDIQLGANVDFYERDRGKPVHEKGHEAGLDLTWWLSNQIQITAGYTFQRIHNPGQITSMTPFIETFAGGVTSNNHFLWTNLTVEF
ncbi:MAG: capsule assembly Wzi family protein [Nitrospirae bacterium]|nr:MAG: capsule assembly Wzi family protein [Nitrospirota bacterium]